MPGEDLIILSADAATEMRSVAVMRGTRMLSQRVSELGASNVLGDIALALEDASISLREVDLFAVTTGPGSFTGLRSGLATMKALAATLKKPVVGVPTLHAIANSVRPAQRVAVMIPAGRGEVFAQILSVNAESEIIEQEAPVHISPAFFIERVARTGGGLKWTGSGAQKFADLIREHASFNGISVVTVDEMRAREPSVIEWELVSTENALAVNVGIIAKMIFESGTSADVEGLRALYIRQSDAEIQEKCRAQS